MIGSMNMGGKSGPSYAMAAAVLRVAGTLRHRTIGRGTKPTGRDSRMRLRR
jgi:hypothetical protein